MMDFDLSEAKYKPLRAFQMHGAGLHGITGNQVTGDCPFCNKDGHFFVNWEKLLWDCKVCGESGNRQTFLEKVNARNLKSITVAQKDSLAEDRGLPTEAFDWVELGHHRGQYTIAVRDTQGKLTDLRLYKIGGKVMSTAGSKANLFGLKEMVKGSIGSTVYICEGEWDTVSMQWLLKAAGKAGAAICSPGAGTFKPEWVDFFQGKDIVVAYDNDAAGMKGELTVQDRLAGKVRSMRFVHWPQGAPIGYDLRDFITKKGVLKRTPKRCYNMLIQLLKTKPRTEGVGATTEILDNRTTPEIDPSVTIEDVFRGFEELLHRPNRMAIEAAIIAMLAGVYRTDPIWLFLVAPPSSGKTAILNSLKYLAAPSDDRALFVSHVTTHSLISGMETKRGDPSIFAQLNGTDRTLVIKDFTPVLSMRPQDKEDIYGQFRDGYDGYTSKMFGNGIKREYNDLRFSCIAAVTEAIYDESSNFASLGERFGKLNMSNGDDLVYARTAMTKAMASRDEFKVMEDKVARLMYSCVKNLMKKAEESEKRLPKLNDELQKAIMGVSLYVAAMRGVVSRDKYKRDYIKSAPSSDMGIRNLKMLAAIAALRAVVYGKDEATIEDLPLIRKIALDTINQRDEELLRNIYLLSQKKDDHPNMAEAKEGSRYTPYTVKCVMEDLVMLNILERKKEGRRFSYELSSRMSEIIKEAKIYDDPVLLKRQNPKIRLGRSRTGEGKFSGKKKLLIRRRRN